jgi:hypothetical protein
MTAAPACSAIRPKSSRGRWRRMREEELMKEEKICKKAEEM